MSKKRLIIFDMDGTLYDLKDVLPMIFQMQVCFLSVHKGISNEEAKKLMEENHIYKDIRKESRSATEFFIEIGLDKKEWSEYRNKMFDVGKIDKHKAVNQQKILSFSRHGTIVLLSSNAYHVIQKILKYLDIHPSVFDDIICSDRLPDRVPFRKELAMKYLSEKYKVCYQNILSIGDRFDTDIKPILHLGGKGILVKGPSALEKVENDLNLGFMNTCDLYEYYNKSEDYEPSNKEIYYRKNSLFV